MSLAHNVLHRYFRASSGLVIDAAFEHTISHVEKKLKGSKQKKFLDSIKIIRDSVTQGSWVTRGAVKAQSGLYQGFVAKYPNQDLHDVGTDEWHEDNAMKMSLKYGRPYHGNKTLPEDFVGIDSGSQKAWFHVCNEVDRLSDLLKKARPKPVITEMGLSPKVTKTFQEMGVDVDLKTVKVPPIIKIGERPMLDDQGQPIVRGGKPVMEDIYKVDWTPGVKFGLSRFSHSDCQACGKRIPSNLYVPIEAGFTKGETTGRLGLFVGKDCAKNIFGVKDEGLRKDQIKNV